ncbi:MAG: alpha/beta fold hydrolase [Akkermansiaceae bacterium]|nr:alpha/beta fold hydrolase [Akkermansiaceae bacterium]
MLAAIYVVLVIASHLATIFWQSGNRPFDKQRRILEVAGHNLSYVEWGGSDPRRTPLILLHGSPGRGARDWESFGPEAAKDGRRVIAVDRWGYGDSEPYVEDYSYHSDAAAVIGLMDQLGIQRAHVAGWSYGGAPAIVLGDLHPDRIRSVTLVSSIGIQKGEGSGSYLVEHIKYSLGFVFFVALPEVIPHFGLLGPRSSRYAFIRDFLDGDQRSLELRLGTLTQPVLITHGKFDPFVPAWVAQEHHRIQPRSRLLMLNGSHFYPFGFSPDVNFEIAVKEIRGFLAAVDAGKADSTFGFRNLNARKDFRALWDGGPPLRGYKPWWLIMLGGTVLGMFIPRTGAAFAGLGGALLLFDLGTALAGVLLGSVIRIGESTRGRNVAWVLALGLLMAIPGAFLLPFL